MVSGRKFPIQYKTINMIFICIVMKNALTEIFVKF